MIHDKATREDGRGPIKRRQRGAANPWMIIGWILVAMIVLPLALCTMGGIAFVGGTAKDEYKHLTDAASAAAAASAASAVR